MVRLANSSVDAAGMIGIAVSVSSCEKNFAEALRSGMLDSSNIAKPEEIFSVSDLVVLGFVLKVVVSDGEAPVMVIPTGVVYTATVSVSETKLSVMIGIDVMLAAFPTRMTVAEGSAIVLSRVSDPVFTCDILEYEIVSAGLVMTSVASAL